MICLGLNANKSLNNNH